MHGLTIATATLALIAADGALAQSGPGAPYPVPGRGETVTTVAAPAPQPARAARPPRWGTKIGGRWWAGANAPGGWDAYRRPSTGWALPPYWNAPRFRVTDWDRYGLARPAPGRTWVRYYDDAVLIDARGSVYDSAADVDWDRFDRDDYVRAAPGYGARTYEGRGDNGLGGAAIGAVAGGVAGNLIAGRGDKLGGTLIGAGVGAAAGYAIDRAEDRRAPPPARHRWHGRDRDDYADGYDYPVAPPYAPPPPPPPSRWVSPDGATVVTTTIGGPAGGYGYTYPGGATTTVTVQTTPVVTTTTTEYYDAPATYRRHVVRSKRVRTKLIRAR